MVDIDSLPKLFKGKKGLEIGGYSSIFSARGLIPIYAIAGELHNCNFKEAPVWYNYALVDGANLPWFHQGPSCQHIAEGCDLSFAPDGSFDFVVASHVLEHMANPLKALKEWLRVLRDAGVLLVIAPHKEATFDHARPRTPLSHLIEDYEKDVDEDDTTHFHEILALHDLRLDPPANPKKHFIARTLDNLNNRCVHHHVWVTEDLLELFDCVGLDVIHLSTAKPWNIIIAGQYSRNASLGDIHARNSLLKFPGAAWRKNSPFSVDNNQGQKPISKFRFFLNGGLILRWKLFYHFRKT